MSYKKIFDPEPIESFLPDDLTKPSFLEGDRRDGLVYIYTDEIILAVNVAIATGRPLLVRGLTGSGKSSLALNVARCLGWRYYEEVISSRTQARDLLWRFDALRRLSDAQVGQLQENAVSYIEPGILWWAFDRDSAKRRGAPPDLSNFLLAIEPGDDTDHERAVVLLDEIDKADPDVPNNLLVPLGSLQFVIQETGVLVQASHPPLVFITSNDERELPRAFLRRCITLVLESPNENRLVEIAEAHFGPDHSDLYRRIAERTIQLAPKNRKSRQTVPSTAEYLDAVLACLKLGVDPGDPDDEIWEIISRVTLSKPNNLIQGV